MSRRGGNCRLKLKQTPVHCRNYEGANVSWRDETYRREKPWAAAIGYGPVADGRLLASGVDSCSMLHYRNYVLRMGARKVFKVRTCQC